MKIAAFLLCTQVALAADLATLAALPPTDSSLPQKFLAWLLPNLETAKQQILSSPASKRLGYFVYPGPRPGWFALRTTIKEGCAVAQQLYLIDGSSGHKILARDERPLTEAVEDFHEISFSSPMADGSVYLAGLRRSQDCGSVGVALYRLGLHRIAADGNVTSVAVPDGRFAAWSKDPELGILWGSNHFRLPAWELSQRAGGSYLPFQRIYEFEAQGLRRIPPFARSNRAFLDFWLDAPAAVLAQNPTLQADPSLIAERGKWLQQLGPRLFCTDIALDAALASLVCRAEKTNVQFLIRNQQMIAITAIPK